MDTIDLRKNLLSPLTEIDKNFVVYFGYFNNYIQTIKYSNAVLQDNVKLQQQNTLLNSLILERDIEEVSKSVITNHTGLYNQSFTNVRILKILKKDNDLYLLVNKGSSHGINDGRVVVYQNNLIGYVSKTGLKTSEVFYYINKSLKIPSYVNSLTEDLLFTCSTYAQCGIESLQSVVNKLSLKDPLLQVKTSGIGGFYPRDLLLGNLDTELLQKTGSSPVYIPLEVKYLQNLIILNGN